MKQTISPLKNTEMKISCINLELIVIDILKYFRSFMEIGGQIKKIII